MGDPGLHSKFVEMQQEQAFAPRDHAVIPNPYVEGLKLDRARILQLLSRATHRNRVRSLHKALKDIDAKLNRKT